jgi:hypothetical protein
MITDCLGSARHISPSGSRAFGSKESLFVVPFFGVPCLAGGTVAQWQVEQNTITFNAAISACHSLQIS